MNTMIAAHGGTLINRVLQGPALDEAKKEAEALPRLPVDYDTGRDVQNIARGVFSPIEGFVGSADLASILENNRLLSGAAWTIPIMLDVPAQDTVAAGGKYLLVWANDPDRALAILDVDEVYAWDRQKAAEAVFGTGDEAHPGVAGYLKRNPYLVGGKISLIDNDRGPYAAHNRFPAETRALFEERGWQTVCAFQTRNVPHAGHEDLQKTVLGLVDGLLIHPIIGKKKKGDFTDESILAAYDALIAEYFVHERVLLNILPTEMRYAGPKEAIMHAIMRKNYGCTHIIIGRDHAGVGKYYGEDEAIEFFANFPDLEIAPVFIRGDFWYCKRCGRVASNRTCPHSEDVQISFSGTQIRQMIVDGQAPPAEIMRPEVFEAIEKFADPFVG
jgi:sulfate adenylyltransferase